eukprot:7272938-Prymnesium_polylepis.1
MCPNPFKHSVLHLRWVTPAQTRLGAYYFREYRTASDSRGPRCERLVPRVAPLCEAAQAVRAGGKLQTRMLRTAR